ncbi:MAG: AAA family ATPase [Chloroflexi bacterium]|nr:AAA family ATPase [Chloroflexota bacterium]
MKGLFGMFDHEIELKLESRITIIYGPNGVGKTVLTEMVHGLFQHNYELLGATPFQHLRVDFDSGESITVARLEATNRLSIQYDDGTAEIDLPFQPVILDEDGLIEVVKAHFPEIGVVYKGGERLFMFGYEDDLDSDMYADQISLDVLPLLDRTDFFGWLYGFSEEPSYWSESLPFAEMPDWFRQNFGGANKRIHTDIIRTQRLIGDDEILISPLIPTPDERLPVDAYFIPTPERRVSKFAKEFRDSLLRALQSAADLEDLQALVEIERPFKLFQDIVNGRLLFKSLKIEDYEFTFVADSGDEVSLSYLSSGEQQLLILYYHLLFEIQPDTLVMIDEPELSMNVVWQRNFLKDLQRIIELRKFDVLIATHSPQIIHDKWDWVVHLGEKVDD